MNNRIVFCGDLVLPFNTKVDYSEIKGVLKDKRVVSNLEGAILRKEEQLKEYRWSDKYSLYSSINIIPVMKDLGVTIVSLCNNHILDYKSSLSETEHLLKENGINSFGIKNCDFLRTEFNGLPLYLITFTTCANGHPFSLYHPDEVVRIVRELKAKESCLVVLFPHWGIERLPYVEPADREHAHRCIDAGADLIIGHHPHIIQQIELYKGKTIVYSVGNFIFPQTYYGEKKLVFDNPDIQNELIVEWDGEKVYFNVLHYDIKENVLTIVDDTNKYLKYIPVNQTNKEYKAFFKSKVSKKIYYIFRRNADSYYGELLCYSKIICFRIFRKFLIKAGLHTPK